MRSWLRTSAYIWIRHIWRILRVRKVGGGLCKEVRHEGAAESLCA